MPFFSVTRRHLRAQTVADAQPLALVTREPSLRATRSLQQLGCEPDFVDAPRSHTSLAYSQVPAPLDRAAPMPPPRELVAKTLKSHSHYATEFVAHIYQSEPGFAGWAHEHGGASPLYRRELTRPLPAQSWGWMLGKMRQATERNIAALERARSSTIDDFAQMVQVALLAAHEFNRLLVYQLHFKDDVRARLMLHADAAAAAPTLMVEGLSDHLAQRTMWRLPLHGWQTLLASIESSPLRGVRSMEAAVNYWGQLEQSFVAIAQMLEGPEGRFVMSPAAHQALTAQRAEVRRHIDDLLRGLGDFGRRPGWPVQRPAQNAPLLAALTPLPTTLEPVMMEPIVSAPPRTQEAPRVQPQNVVPPAPAVRERSHTLPRIAHSDGALSVPGLMPQQQPPRAPVASAPKALTSEPREPPAAVTPRNRVLAPSVPAAVALAAPERSLRGEDVSEEVRRMMDEMWTLARND